MAIRILLLGSEGFIHDINCFKSWSIMLYENGFSNFYISEAFTDYPPGYMYVLYVIGFIRQMFDLEYYSAAFTALIKMPAILCDVGLVAFLYYFARKHLKKKYAFWIALAYALNPAVVINSAVWGQVDAVHTLLILISLYFMTSKGENRLLFSYALYGFALLIKPQSLMFGPIYAFSAYSFLSENRFSKKSITTLGQDCAIGLGIIILGIFPFARSFDFSPVIDQYVNTILSYPFASVNAYNFHSLFGGNWMPESNMLLFLSHGDWGMLFIICTSILTIFILYKKNTPDNYFFAAALINALTFVFSARMHERYIFPVITLLTAAYIIRRAKSTLFLLVMLSITLYINCADVLHTVTREVERQNLNLNIIPISLVNVGLAVFMVYIAIVYAIGDRRVKFEWKWLSNPLPARYEMIAVAAIILISAVTAFVNLGDNFAPESAWQSRPEAIADLGKEAHVTSIIFMNGTTENRRFALSYAKDDAVWSEDWILDSGSVFAWQELEAGFTARYIKIHSLSDDLMLMEMGFKNNGHVLPLRLEGDGRSAALFDEQHLAPDSPTFHNSTYFDEIYHARTAYEFLHGLTPYETTHPPLGKVIISWGITIFGMNPFGFRVMGVLFGILLLPLIYAFARRIFGAGFWPIFAVALFAADFMRFSQTRIATLDVFVTFFILAAFYFMYCFCTTGRQTIKQGDDCCIHPDEGAMPLSRLLMPLALSGLCMGLAIAVKWQGVYAGIGLAAVFFTNLWHRRTGAALKKKVMPIIGSCFIFFIAVPITVYILSYIPFLSALGMDGLKSVWENQVSMFEYHSQLQDRHPFESPWWQWPLNIRPVFLYVAQASDGLRSAMSVMGNPVIWYSGLIAMIYLALNRPDRTDAFLFTAVCAQMIPWIPIDRCTFIYHYFPIVGFMILLLARTLERNNKRGMAAAISLAAFVLFIIYYPVLSGTPIDPNYVRKYLQWLPTWIII